MPTFINSHKNECYIHIPKTGGFTLTSMLFNEIDLFINIYKNGTDKNNNYNDYQLLHAPAFLITEYDNNLKKYCFVRNPYDRFISCFCNAKDLNIHNYSITSENILEFLQNFNKYKDEYLFKPMTFYIYDKTKTNKLIDNIYYYEDYEKNLINNFKLSKENINNLNENLYINKNKYKNIYDELPILYKYINEIYYEDFINFNYKIQK